MSFRNFDSAGPSDESSRRPTYGRSGGGFGSAPSTGGNPAFGDRRRAGAPGGSRGEPMQTRSWDDEGGAPSAGSAPFRSERGPRRGADAAPTTVEGRSWVDPDLEAQRAARQAAVPVTERRDWAEDGTVEAPPARDGAPFGGDRRMGGEGSGAFGGDRRMGGDRSGAFGGDRDRRMGGEVRETRDWHASAEEASAPSVFNNTRSERGAFGGSAGPSGGMRAWAGEEDAPTSSPFTSSRSGPMGAGMGSAPASRGTRVWDADPGEEMDRESAFQRSGTDRMRGGFRDGPGDGGFTRVRPSGGPSGPRAAAVPGSGRTAGIQDYMHGPSMTAAATVHNVAVAVPVKTEVNAAAVVGKAAELGEDVALATLRTQLAKKVEPFLEGFLSKDDEKKRIAEIKLLATESMRMEVANFVVMRVVDTEKSGDRKNLASLINLLRTSTPVVIDTDVVVAALDRAVQQITDGDVECTSENAGKLRHLIEELGKVPAKKPKSFALSAETFTDKMKAFVAAKPAVSAGAGAAAPAPEVVVPVVAAPVPAPAPAPLSTSVSAASTEEVPMPTQPIEEAAAEVVASGLLGAELAELSVRKMRGYFNRQAAAALMTAVLKAAHTVNATFLALNWLKQEEFGAMIAAHCFEKTDNAVGAVYALQLFMSTIGFPKGLLASIFAKLYEWDVIDEGSLRAWREDTMDRTPGKEKAITQAEAFFDWLDAPEEEESEEESDEDLMDVIKPNNATRLR